MFFFFKENFIDLAKESSGLLFNAFFDILLFYIFYSFKNVSKAVVEVKGVNKSVICHSVHVLVSQFLPLPS